MFEHPSFVQLRQPSVHTTQLSSGATKIDFSAGFVDLVSGFGRSDASTAGEEPAYSTEYRNDPNSSISHTVKAVVGVYGVYDMFRQWEHDQIARPRDQITEKFLGTSPMSNRKVFFESSPISYATVDKNSTRFLLVHGTNDDVVDTATQSTAFLTALKQAQFVARTIVVPGAGHFWITDPIEPGSFGAYAGPKVLLFLKAWL